MSDSLNLSVFVKQTRKRMGLTQVQFAERIGVSFQTVNRWERGKTQPLPMALKLIEQELQQMGQRGADLLEQYLCR